MKAIREKVTRRLVCMWDDDQDHEAVLEDGQEVVELPAVDVGEIERRARQDAAVAPGEEVGAVHLLDGGAVEATPAPTTAPTFAQALGAKLSGKLPTEVVTAADVLAAMEESGEG